MKRLFLIAALAISSASFAQSTIKEDIDVIQAEYGKTKKELVSTHLNLQGTQATAFWKVYDAYEVERKKLGEKRLRLINEYVNHLDSLTDAKADALVKATIQNNIAYENLYTKYYGLTKKAIGSVQAAKILQLEYALQTAIKAETQDAIPFIGEIDHSKKQ